MRTDTVYGLLGRADNIDTVRRIYKIKGRNKKKPLIVLVSSVEQLRDFGVDVEDKYALLLKTMWPAPVSVIFEVKKDYQEKFNYLHSGQNAIAFRMPANKKLLEIIEKSGPLVAPSANPEGHHTATSVDQARLYFGRDVDGYVDGGLVSVSVQPSRVIRFDKDGKVVLLRG